ncbi:glycosyltransferase [Micromonospora sp. M12]
MRRVHAPQRDEVAGIDLITLRTRGGNPVTRMSARLARPVRVLRAMRRRGVARGDVSVVLLPMAMMTVGNWAVLRLALRCPVVVDASERHDRHQFRRGWLAPYFVRHRWSTFLATRLVHRATAVSTTLGGYLERHGLDVLVVPPQVDCDEFAEPRSSSLTGGLRLLYAGTPAARTCSTSSSGDQPTRTAGSGTGAPHHRRRHPRRRRRAVRPGRLRAGLGVGGGDLPRPGARDRVLTLLSESHFSLLVRPTGGYAANGFPSKVPESLSAGCPVLLNYTSDLATYVRDGVEGLVLDGNGPDDVQHGIERALRLRDEDWTAMSRAARERARDSFDHRAWRARVTTFLDPAAP